VNTKSLVVIAASLLTVGSFGQVLAQASKEEIAAKLNSVDPSDITESPVAGVYQIQAGSRVAYITTDGRYLMQGELYDLDTSENLTEQTRAASRVGMLAAVPRESMMIFAPENGPAEHTITIFTDIDCGYCRQFHREIDQVTKLGIEVHYLFYPRTGPNTESWAKAEKVWCAGEADRNAALTRAKLGGEVPKEECSDTPVSAHWQLGHDIGVTGTPSVIASNGEVIGGYLAPNQLLERLETID
jgi:thiol:disulfide interchange protein DsbC